MKGAYVIVVELERDAVVKTKAREFHLEKGFYAYVGSAMGGLSQRIQRHLSSKKHKHWHIDFLLDVAKIIVVMAIPSERYLEEEIARALSDTFNGVDGFGASDSPLRSHLFRLERREIGRLVELVIGRSNHWEEPS